MKFSELNVCPFCGDTVFYSKMYAHGVVRYYQSMIGEEIENEQMYDSLNYDYSDKRYCANCDKLLGYVDSDTVSKQVGEAFRKINAKYPKNKNT